MSHPNAPPPVSAEQRRLVEAYLPWINDLCAPFTARYKLLSDNIESAALYALLVMAISSPERHAETFQESLTLAVITQVLEELPSSAALCAIA